ncbi:FAD/NAD(P)-binding protein [Halapricum hydrolyticum]|uniref:FAD/NAD(P)-binding protein n=1 Tax=Halapricum hydrolyticum TaxID=2979991 RepID=A0AAE3IHS8_9EURY|nr:FAD/NAD(P)-binding protein [Halapricum hydrolyticum]MCU4719713.1 FAD/NAD(P)-binding protein [Halapricum hydrolyticum]MCU4728630.1 FAD/NAD(P)-binding protein [Halapricum hydrolyticum]
MPSEPTDAEPNWVHYEPEEATLVAKTTFNEIDTVFEFELEDRDELGHVPGQFVQVFVPGVGEAPFSVSSSPTKDGPFELCIRKVGSVTTAIHEMEVGDTLGIRGPFGETCDIETFKGNDMLFVAGGIGLAPLRSMINFILYHRDWFRDVTVVYGCKDPTEILFPEEIERWQERDDIRFDITVDEVPEGVEWDDHVGVITTLLPGLKIDAPNTYTIVCGPPVMFQYVQEELDAKEIPHDHIYLSLERRMHCGVGLCGHCQINDLYVCQDGPVFNYEVIKDRPEALS